MNSKCNDAKQGEASPTGHLLHIRIFHWKAVRLHKTICCLEGPMGSRECPIQFRDGLGKNVTYVEDWSSGHFHLATIYMLYHDRQ